MNVAAELLPITAVIISRDAEETIAETLESLRGFEEVVVYDNGSQDRTIEIAREFPNVSLHQGEFFGFGPTKNHAADLARNDWVFSIDSDECVSRDLFANIASAPRDNSGVVYSVLRGNYLRGKCVQHSGWGGDWLLRFYDRRATRLTDVSVHEKVQLPDGGRVVRLQGELAHNAVRELSEFLVKIDRYSEIQRVAPRRVLSPPLIFLRSLWAFIRTYFLRLGFLDGWRGLVIAVSDADGVFFKYMKPYADKAQSKDP